MEDLELAWLIPTFLQVIGLATALGVLGLGYERAMREKILFVDELEHGQEITWLALAGVIFAIGIYFTGMFWVYKGIAIILAVLLIGLAWTSPRTKRVRITAAPKQKPTLKSMGWLSVKIFLGLFLLLILIWGINLSIHGVRLYVLAKSLQADPTQIQSGTILSLVQDAAGEVGAINNELRPLFPIFNFLHVIPRVGPYLGQVEPLMMYADGLAQAGKEVVIGLGPILNDSPVGQTDLSLPERVSQVVQSGQEHFAMAAQAIGQASQVRDHIRPELMPDSIRPLFLKLNGKFDLFVAGVKILQVAPTLLGADQPQKYLVLAQNRDELRATGGFISGIGLLTIQDGKILQFDLGDSYAIDDFSKAYPAPPEPLKRFMLADYWVPRDANWSPDFPTTSRQAQALYTLSTGVQTQGVVAFNQLAIQRVLAVLGPVEVPGTDEAVTAENIEEYMRQAWAPAPQEGLSQEWWLHRKDFMQQLGNVIVDKALKTGDQEQLVNLAKTMMDLLDQGQLMVYLNDPTAQAALKEAGWDEEIVPGRSDYLYLVDTNVGFNKVDSVIQRSLTYQVDLSDLNHPTGKVTLTYQHTGSGDSACKQMVSYGNGTYQDMQQRCYLDYWRLYMPGGSELIDSTAKPVPADELLNGLGWSGQVESLKGEAGSQVLAGLLMLPPAQSSQIEIYYSLPASIIQPMGQTLQEYGLNIQVQPGLEGLPFQLEIKLPNNTNVVNQSEGWKSVSDQRWAWQGLLDRSTQLSLSIRTNP